MKSLMVVGASLVLLTAAAILVEVYFYSWTGAAMNQIGLCEHKTVTTGGYNGSPVPMSFRFEPQAIAREMAAKHGYRVNGNYNGGGALVARDFGTVEYVMIFQARGGTFEGLKLSTRKLNSGMSSGGEDCSTPNRVLRHNVFAMIDDLPLNDEQKAELRSHVSVSRAISIKFF